MGVAATVRTGLRRGVGRLVGPWRERRHGHLFIGRRVLRAQIRRHRAPPASSLPMEFVATADLDATTAVVHTVRPEERHVFELLPDLDPWLRDAPGWHARHRIPPQHVIELTHGIAFGIEGWAGPDTTTLCADVSFGVGWSRARACAVARQALEVGLVDLPGTTASLLQSGGANYYHWLLQGLPMTSLILEAIETATIDRFLVPHTPPRFMDETLDRSGVPADRLMPVPEPTPAYRAERLLVATLPPNSTPPPKWATEYVRGLFAEELARPAADDLLYLRREGSGRGRRTIVNEDELVAALGTLGFREVAMEGRTVADQAALFAGARAVVGLHGAGLANLVFARPGTLAVEIVPANAAIAVYHLVARQVGVDHRPIVGVEARPPRRYRLYLTDANVVVDVPSVVKTVATALDGA